MNASLYAAVELGGTKTICLVGHNEHDIVASLTIPTTNADETLAGVAEFFSKFKPLSGIGIGAFGPLNVNKNSNHYGRIENTPKPGWRNTNLHDVFAQKFNCPVVIDTDVNAAGLAEYHLGAGKNLDNFIYITVGTGIGGGAIINGKPVHGLSHPEIGHITLPRHPHDKAFECGCPFHSSCAEGLASGTAIKKRWSASLQTIESDHIAWDIEADYLAELSHTLTVVYSPQRIIFGGGVSSEFLLGKVRDKLFEKLNGYVNALGERERLDSYLSLPQLGGEAGPKGSLLLALLP